MVSLHIGATEMRYNIRIIKKYKSDTQVEYYSLNNMYDDVRILLSVIYLCLNIKSWIQSI